MNRRNKEIHLVKWSGIVKATLPDLVYRSFRSGIIRACWVGTDREHRPPANTSLYNDKHRPIAKAE